MVVARYKKDDLLNC